MSVLVNHKNLDFLLYNVFNAQELLKIPRYQEHDKETFNSVMELAHKMAMEFYLDHNSKGDECEPKLKDGEVITIEEIKTAWKQYADSGLLNAKHSYEEGGMQLPSLINLTCGAYFASANPGTSAYSFLTGAASNLIHTFGSEEQKSKYLKPMWNGRFAGTMVLTEPDTGSSLGDLVTRASKTHNGDYLIKGQKIFISGGDQDITENIIHLVLARVDGAKRGVKGLSLFIVPKLKLASGEKNDVLVTGLFHKMGYRGTASTALSFGENNSCVGELIGQENHGLQYMFQMMNEARISVGFGATMIGQRGYLASLEYAKQRPQGRLISNDKQGDHPPVNIIEHTDVKRMLLAQKSYVEGSLALCLFSARLLDEQEACGNKDSGYLLDLLTPVVKSFPSSYGPKANDLAIQILGGAGYTREFPVEQCYRDNRLNPIHEGTYGIQSLDLLGRKLWQEDGLGLKLLLSRIHTTLDSGIKKAETKSYIDEFDKYLKIFIETTKSLGVTLHKGEYQLALANSALYLDMMGKIVVGWLWIEMADKAIDTYQDSQNEEDQNFYKGKLQAAKYFIKWELPQVEHQAQLLQSLDPTCLDMKTDWF